MSRAPDVLQMKVETVLKFLAAGTHSGGTQLNFQMRRYIYKRKSDSIYIINLKNLGEAHAIIAVKNPADVSIISSRNISQQTRISGRITPRTLSNLIQVASGSCTLWWLLIPGPTRSFSQGHLMLTCLPSLPVTRTVLCTMRLFPSQATISELTHLRWWMPTQGFLRMCGTTLPAPVGGPT